MASMEAANFEGGGKVSPVELPPNMRSRHGCVRAMGHSPGEFWVGVLTGQSSPSRKSVTDKFSLLLNDRSCPYTHEPSDEL